MVDNPNTMEWFKSRRYLHFDRPIGFKKAKKIVEDPTRVSRHSFYPLISYNINSTKLKKDKVTGQIKRENKERPIAYASHVDSHIYSYYSKILNDLYEIEINEKNISESILAFRALGKSNIDFANDAFTAICDKGECAAVSIDISGFFDNLDHKILKEKWAYLLGDIKLPDDHFNIYKSLTKYSSVDKIKLYSEFGISPYNPRKRRSRICGAEDFRSRVRGKGLIDIHKLNKGIPQGTPISALLSNIYMLDFDEYMASYMHRVEGIYYRYCDDILFIVPIHLKNKIAGDVATKLKGMELELNPSKTIISEYRYENGILNADKPLQYLGFLFDGQRIVVRSAALARFSERMKAGVRLAKRTKIKHNNARIGLGLDPKPLYKRKLYKRYSYLGNQNFIKYALRAANKMNSKAIKRQIKPLWSRLQDEIKKS